MLAATAKQAGGAGDAAPRTGHRLNVHLVTAHHFYCSRCPSSRDPVSLPERQRGRNHP